MASIEAALIAALIADAGVSAKVGSRVFIHGGRQGAAYPYITLQRISTQGAAHLDGASNLDWPMFQIDAWSSASALEALEAAEAVRLAIDHVEFAGPPAFEATFQDQRGPAPDEETRNFRVSQDYLVFHERN